MKNIRPLIPSLCMLVLSLVSCADDAGTAANQPYDEADIRSKVYTSLYTVLKIDTIGYNVMAIAVGDSLRNDFFWPRRFTPHPEPVLSLLSGMLPLRIVGIDEIDPPGEVIPNEPYRTMDTGEPAMPAFTKAIERMDATHLVVVCGIVCPLELSAYAACNLAFVNGEWLVESMDFYYLRSWQ